MGVSSDVLCHPLSLMSLAFWGVPIVVQPMKAIASVAIAQKFSLEQNMAAGMVTAIMITLLSALGLIRRLGILVPVPFVLASLYPSILILPE